MADWILRHLNQHGIARLESGFDAARLPLEASGIPIDLARVEHGVAAATDINEGGFHRRENVLDLTEVNVAHHRCVRLLRHVVLDEDVVFEHHDLGAARSFAHDHRALNGLTASEELRLGNRVAPTAGFAALATALLLRFQASRALDSLDFVPRLANLDDGVRWIVGVGLIRAA